MRAPTSSHKVRILVGAALLLATLLAATGCATMRATARAYDVGPNGINKSQQRLRTSLATSDFATALGWQEDDALLRDLNIGASAYYASQFARSAALLDSAALLADDRITSSIRGNALALVTNDLALPYKPRRTERLFIAYYAMLSYARLDAWEDAAVEARRLSALLAQDPGDSSNDRAMLAALHYLAATIFERSGEREDAGVEYRLAGARQQTGKVSPDSGDIIVIVERGFVAHRVTESINVILNDTDRDELTGGRERRNTSAARIAEEIVNGTRVGGRHHHDSDDAYWLSIAIPAVRRSARSSGSVAVSLEGTTEIARMFADVDAATLADENGERVSELARAVTRAAAKYSVTKAIKDKKGEVAGTVANIGASLMERADIRSWHVLPQRIDIVRLRLPVGPHQFAIAVGGSSAGTQLDTLMVRSGRVSIATTRIWSEPRQRILADR